MNNLENIQEVIFLSDNMAAAHIIQGFAETYLKSTINFKNVLYLKENKMTNKLEFNKVILDSKQVMKEIGIEKVQYEELFIVSSIKELERFDNTKLVICVFDSSTKCDSFLKNPEFFNLPLKQILKLNLPFKEVSLIDDYISRIKALKYNRDILGIQIKGYELYFDANKFVYST